MDILSKRIRDLRIDADLKQSEMAAKIGVTQNMVSYFENGREVPPSIIIKYAHHFGVSTDYLLGLASDPRPATMDEGKAYGALAHLCEHAGGKSVTSMDVLALIARFTAYYKAGAPAGNAPMDCFTAYLAAMGHVLDAATSGNTASLLDKTNAVAACGLRANDIFKRYMELEQAKK